MSKIEDGGAAFPIDSYMLNPNATQKEIKEAQGMTLRDYFAAAALQGLLAHVIGVTNAKNEHDYAKRCYQYADAMIKARKGDAL